MTVDMEIILKLLGAVVSVVGLAIAGVRYVHAQGIEQAAAWRRAIEVSDAAWRAAVSATDGAWRQEAEKRDNAWRAAMEARDAIWRNQVADLVKTHGEDVKGMRREVDECHSRINRTRDEMAKHADLINHMDRLSADLKDLSRRMDLLIAPPAGRGAAD